jgi:NlpC/P60 family putative phage cell wall peptidase
MLIPEVAPSRAAIVALARAWLGTPYHHQASERAAGVDCIGLVRGIYRALYGCEPAPLPGYSRDWSEVSGEETLLHAASSHLVGIDPARARPGDVLVFRYRARHVAKHAGILASAVDGGSLFRLSAGRHDPATASPTFIHAAEGAPVAEVPLSPWWQRRIAGAFSFPGVID